MPEEKRRRLAIRRAKAATVNVASPYWSVVQFVLLAERTWYSAMCSCKSLSVLLPTSSGLLVRVCLLAFEAVAGAAFVVDEVAGIPRLARRATAGSACMSAKSRMVHLRKTNRGVSIVPPSKKGAHEEATIVLLG